MRDRARGIFGASLLSLIFMAVASAQFRPVEPIRPIGSGATGCNPEQERCEEPGMPHHEQELASCEELTDSTRHAKNDYVPKCDQSETRPDAKASRSSTDDSAQVQSVSERNEIANNVSPIESVGEQPETRQTPSATLWYLALAFFAVVFIVAVCVTNR
jgi:hypothetical protein